VAKKAAEEAEMERKKKELEAERKRAAMAARESYKPKDYSPEEKDAYQKYAEEMSTFFGELIARQKAGLTKEEADAMKQQEASVRDSQAQIDPEAEEKPVEEKIPVNYGSRSVRDKFIDYDFTYMCEKICHIVPEPMWPDPDKEPLPPALINSIIKKVPVRDERAQITSYSIWTPMEGEGDVVEPEVDAAADGDVDPD
jgi:hypothetical protein